MQSAVSAPVQKESSRRARGDLDQLMGTRAIHAGCASLRCLRSSTFVSVSAL